MYKFNILFQYGNIKTILTGLQPTGSIQLGNYFSTIDNIISIQKQFDQIYIFIADLHSLSTCIKKQHSLLKYTQQNIYLHSINMVKLFIASGLDLNKCHIFIQSHVLQHTQLAWILSCLTPQHWLNSMIQYKEKKHQISSIGLYTYPILMAADILLYKTTHVPVGADQQQHLQLTRKIGKRFNSQFQVQLFPEFQYLESRTPKIMSLIDPNKKMSKSDVNQRSRINISDSSQQISNKIRRAVTDSQGNKITYQPDLRQGLANLLRIYSACKGLTIQTIMKERRISQFTIAEFKKQLINIIVDKFQEINKKMDKISQKDTQQILKQGAINARKQANRTIQEVYQSIKLSKLNK